MIYDPATDTTSINYGHPPAPPGPESSLQREWRALATTVLVVLLAPIWLVQKATRSARSGGKIELTLSKRKC